MRRKRTPREELPTTTLQYLGHVIQSDEILVGIIGDGVNSIATVDLMAQPYNMSFPKASYPVGWLLKPQDGVMPSGVSISGSVFTFTFDDPPPPPQPGTLSPRVQFTMYLLYV